MVYLITVWTMIRRLLMYVTYMLCHMPFVVKTTSTKTTDIVPRRVVMSVSMSNVRS